MDDELAWVNKSKPGQATLHSDGLSLGTKVDVAHVQRLLLIICNMC